VTLLLSVRAGLAQSHGPRPPSSSIGHPIETVAHAKSLHKDGAKSL